MSATNEANTNRPDGRGDALEVVPVAVDTEPDEPDVVRCSSPSEASVSSLTVDRDRPDNDRRIVAGRDGNRGRLIA